MSATEILRADLLRGRWLLIAAPSVADGSLAGAVQAGCAGLGARVSTCRPDPVEEDAMDRAVAESGDVDMLVVDAAGLFARRSAAGAGAGNDVDSQPTPLRACLDATWNITRAVVNHAFLPVPADRVAREIVYLAPTPDAGEHALAARAGLENLARTLSVEWARQRINVLTIAPGVATAAEDVAALVAYLASPAGAYFSGCLLDLGAGTRSLSW